MLIAICITIDLMWEKLTSPVGIPDRLGEIRATSSGQFLELLSLPWDARASPTRNAGSVVNICVLYCFK